MELSGSPNHEKGNWLYTTSIEFVFVDGYRIQHWARQWEEGIWISSFVPRGLQSGRKEE